MKTSKISIKQLKCFVALFLICFIVIQTLQFSMNDDLIANSKKEQNFQINNEGNIDDVQPLMQDKSSLLKFPFFDNLTGIIQWFGNNLTNNRSSGSFKGFFAETNRDGSTVTDKKIYFEDSAVGFDALFELIGIDDVWKRLAFYNDLKSTNFWDSENGGGYFTYLDEFYEDNSTIKEIGGNAQPILTFIDYLITNNPDKSEYDKADQNIPNFIIDQWGVLESEFYDSDINLYNHSNVDDNKYSIDQFIAAIAGFKIHRINDVWISDESHGNMKLNANQTATNIMEKMIDKFWMDTGNAFSKIRNNDITISINENIDLASNAYGIWALSEMYIASKFEDESLKNYAEDIFNSLNDTLFNSTYSLYMTEADYTSNIVQNYEIILEDNAVMILALKSLLEITGNFSYFEMINTLIEGLLSNMRDEIHGNYYYSILEDDGNNDPDFAIYNDTKSLRAHSYLFRSYYEIVDISNYFFTNITLNSTSEIKGQIEQLNVTISSQLNISLVIDEIGLENEIITPIPNADFLLTFRYPNETLISRNDYTGNENGTISINLDIDENFPLGDYEISYHSNYTNLYPVFNTAIFSLESGLEIVSIEFLSNLENDDNLYVGGNGILNLTINNTHSQDMFFNFSYIGSGIDDGFDFITLKGDGVETNVSIELGFLSNAEIGDSYFTLDIINNSIIYQGFNISYELNSPIKLSYVVIPQKLFIEINNTINFQINNIVEHSFDLNIKISGENIETNDYTKTLTSSGKLSISSNISINEDFEYNQFISFSINITRVNDNETFLYRAFNVILKPAIEIVSISLKSEYVHGEQPLLLTKIINHLNLNQDIYVQIDSEQSSFSLNSGENTLNIPVGKKLSNPYDFNDRFHEVQISDNNSNIIYQNVFVFNVRYSNNYVFWGYIFPLVIPLAIALITRHFYVENKKRMGQL